MSIHVPLQESVRQQVTRLVPPQIKTILNSNNNASIVWNERGCQVRTGRMSDEQIQQVLKMPPPTGLAVTLARNTKNSNKPNVKPVQHRFLCHNIPTQQAYLYEPHGIDLLILLEMKGVVMQDVVRCLGLKNVTAHDGNDNVRVWTNLDGTTLTTHEYRSETGRGRVYLSADFVMPYPDYIQRNISILQEKMEDCPSPHDYVQGCRYYSGEALQLGILQEYDYLLKVDSDVNMNATIPFHMLHDMRIQGSIFGHTAAYAGRGGRACTHGIKSARKRLEKIAKNTSDSRRPEWAKKINWKGPCSAGVKQFERSVDEYYANFIIMETKFWQSEPVRAFGKYFNEIYPGFFRYRWGDQPFFAMAMGLFVGPDFRKYTTDYTELRCKHHPECWYFWREWAENRTYCQSGGYFDHDKVLRKWQKEFPDVIPTRGKTPFVNKIVQDCKRQSG